jgi:hypothetical protein
MTQNNAADADTATSTNPAKTEAPRKRPKAASKRTKPADVAPARNKPERFLPTERIKFERQLELLRAYAAASGPAVKAVTNREVATFVNMTESTTSMANAFFTQSGFLQKTAEGLVPAPEVVSYQRAFQWNPEKASHKMAPLVLRTWFGEALIRRLTLKPMEEEQAIQTLAEAANADTRYKANLALLIEYLVAAGLVEREGTQLRASRQGHQAATESQPPAPPNADPLPREIPQRSAAVAASFSAPTEGTVQFHVSVRVDMAEMAGWQPERIAAFFAGIAQVLAAKGSIEKTVTGE